MLDPIADLYQFLSSRPYIADKLASYADGPAIFAGQVPSDHDIKTPVVILDYPSVNQRLQTSSNTNRDIETTLRIYAQVQTPSGMNTWPLQSAAETIANALVTARILVTGGVLRGANVKGPIHAPTEDKTLAGRLITVRWRIEEF